MDLLVHTRDFHAETSDQDIPASAAIQAMWERIYKEWLPVVEYELIPDYVSEICIPVSYNRKKNNN